MNQILSNILSNIFLFFVITICALSSSLTASYITGEWHWFSRSGAIVTMCGVILSVRPIVRKSFKEWLEDQHTIDCGTIGGNSPKEIEDAKQIKLDLIASYSGIGLTVLGTLIWGYGNLIK